MTAGAETTVGLGSPALDAVAAGLAAVGLGSDRSFTSGLAFCVEGGLAATPAELPVPDEVEEVLGDELVEEAEEVVAELEPPEVGDEVLVEVVVGSVVTAGFGAGAGIGFGLGFGVVSVAAGVVSVGAGSGAGSSASAAGATATANAAPARMAAARTRITLGAGRAPQLTTLASPFTAPLSSLSVRVKWRSGTHLVSRARATCARPAPAHSTGT